jgi:folate-dependent phosphoribosylglycinamide formyltransferase PurN
MFKGRPKSKDYRRRVEAQRYNPSVIIIFNKKAYANISNLIDWVKNQYSMASVYPLRDNEPRFLALDAFAPHKNKGAKVRKNELEAAKKKRQTKERLQQELCDAFKKLNVTLLIIPGGYTGYVQVLDVLINKLIKAYIEEYKDQWIKEYFDE